MARKVILVLLILIFLSVLAIVHINSDSVDIYIDGENVSVETRTLKDINQNALNVEICDLTISTMNNTAYNITTLKNGIGDLCKRYGLENPKINVESVLGPDQIPVIVNVDGTSMLPTLQDGQTVLLNKTRNVHVGDIVVAESDEFGGIIKRVDKISKNSIHLVSDNKEVSYEYINGILYEKQGISTWVDISDINGVVIDY